jgi:hypothetical protein
LLHPLQLSCLHLLFLRSFGVRPIAVHFSKLEDELLTSRVLQTLMASSLKAKTFIGMFLYSPPSEMRRKHCMRFLYCRRSYNQAFAKHNIRSASSGGLVQWSTELYDSVCSSGTAIARSVIYSV